MVTVMVNPTATGKTLCGPFHIQLWQLLLLPLLMMCHSQLLEKRLQLRLQELISSAVEVEDPAAALVA